MFWVARAENLLNLNTQESGGKETEQRPLSDDEVLGIPGFQPVLVITCCSTSVGADAMILCSTCSSGRHIAPAPAVHTAPVQVIWYVAPALLDRVGCLGSNNDEWCSEA